MELKYEGKRIIAAVAQNPFVHGACTFCKLIPLFSHADGDDHVINPQDFYNDGEIWWRLALTTNAHTISPGMMMEVLVEKSSQESNANDPTKSVYQAKFLSKEENLDASAGAEVFHITSETAQTLRRFKGEGATIALPHSPAKEIFLHIGEYIYGPFSTAVTPVEVGHADGMFLIKVNTAGGNLAVLHRMKKSDFYARYEVLSTGIHVSLDERGCRLSALLQEVDFDYLTPSVCLSIRNDFSSEVWEALDWEPLSAKFTRLATGIKTFSRAKKQQLKNLLQELENSRGTANGAEEFKKMTADIQDLSEEDESAYMALCEAVLASGLSTNKRVEQALESYCSKYVEDQKDKLETELEDLKTEVQTLTKKCADEEQRLSHDRELRRSEQKRDTERLRQQLDKQRDAAKKEIEDARKKWQIEYNQQNTDLTGRKKQLDAILEEIKSRTAKSAVDCLTLLPFLKEMGLTGGTMAAAQPSAERAPAAPVSPLIATGNFVLPESLHIPSPAAKNMITEMAFLEHFIGYAAACGYTYDWHDLRRFHVSMVCEDITILEGASGIGKTSLANLYGDVLAGEKAIYPRMGTHTVHVNPTWMERSDLLGYVNTVTAQFAPAETGLYTQLIYAQTDMANNTANAALYPICLDEMNLAQVEHYFSDFMQILELPQDKRLLPCFSPEAVAANSTFRNYATLTLAPSVKFIGTVNFDETTRRLSARLLDRTNLICLTNLAHNSSGTHPAPGTVGKGVAYGLFSSWRKSASLSPALNKHLQDMVEPLSKLGVTVSPRVREAMARYVASMRPLVTAGEDAELVAFDEQLAQRVLSKVRSITSVAQKKALDSLATMVDAFRDPNYSPSAAALARLRAKEHFFGYESES